MDECKPLGAGSSFGSHGVQAVDAETIAETTRGTRVRSHTVAVDADAKRGTGELAVVAWADTPPLFGAT